MEDTKNTSSKKEEMLKKYFLALGKLQHKMGQTHLYDAKGNKHPIGYYYSYPPVSKEYLETNPVYPKWDCTIRVRSTQQIILSAQPFEIKEKDYV